MVAYSSGLGKLWKERAMGFEPTISCLGSMRSTTELRPHHERIVLAPSFRVNGPYRLLLPGYT